MSSATEIMAGTGGTERDVPALVVRTREFVHDVVMPAEDRSDGDVTLAGGDGLRRELQTEAQRRGLLAPVATPAQQEQYLAPLVRGEVRSSFAMTEPAPGAGSDPAALSTTATRVPGGWRIDGRKIFITGADGAGFLIIMARTRGAAGNRGGGTMFLASAEARNMVPP